MTTFVDIVLCFYLYCSAHEVRRLSRDKRLSFEQIVGYTIMVGVTTVAITYVTGWQVLPSWGFGSIPKFRSCH